MAKFVLPVNHDGGVFEEPMDAWQPGGRHGDAG